MYITAEGYKMVDSKADLIEFVMKQSRNKFYDTFDSLVELRPLHETHVSFNKRAWVAVSMSRVVLISYNTIVCGWSSNYGFVRHWGDYSSTTMRHINEFRKQLGYPSLSKKAWEALPVKKWGE